MKLTRLLTAPLLLELDIGMSFPNDFGDYMKSTHSRAAKLFSLQLFDGFQILFHILYHTQWIWSLSFYLVTEELLLPTQI